VNSRITQTIFETRQQECHFSGVILQTTIEHCVEGAKTAAGTVVVIDVFRASNTILMLLAQGASSVIPTKTVDEAFSLKEKNPDCLLVGERKGIKVEGFDIGNSPHEASSMRLIDKHIIMTTSAGTQAIGHAESAERVLIGSFGNAIALCEMLLQLRPPLVSWLPAGTEGLSQAVEDELCALYLDGVLKGRPDDFQSLKARILAGEGAKRLRRLGQQDDFAYCLTTNLFDFVPQLVWPESDASFCRIVRASAK
jgi:2-phosphosulfolactate phosphatase